jgi:hypothetical protein
MKAAYLFGRPKRLRPFGQCGFHVGKGLDHSLVKGIPEIHPYFSTFIK